MEPLWPRPGERVGGTNSSAPRYRIESELCRGRTFDLLYASDTELDGRRVIVKRARTAPPAEGRCAWPAIEMEALGARSSLLPEPLDVLALSRSAEERDAGAGAERRSPALVLSWLPGDPLPEVLRARDDGTLPLDRSLRIARSVAGALAALHSRGFVARSLAPEHVIVDAEGQARIVGIGNATRPGEPPPDWKAGTHPAFSAPEVLNDPGGMALSPRADLYSLGALLMNLLIADPPAAMDPTDDERERFVRLMAISPGAALVVARCLSTAPRDRPESASMLADCLRQGSLPGPNDRGWGPTAAALAELLDGRRAAWSGSFTVSRHLREGVAGARRTDASRLSGGPLVVRSSAPLPPVAAGAGTGVASVHAIAGHAGPAGTVPPDSGGGGATSAGPIVPAHAPVPRPPAAAGRRGGCLGWLGGFFGAALLLAAAAIALARLATG